MKKILLTLSGLLFLSGIGIAQHAVYGLGFSGDANYATISDNASLDIVDEFTVEMWFKPTGNVMDDQKLLGKTAATFPLVDSYVIGFINGEVLFEVFDESSGGLNTKGGTVIANSWNHVAGTFNENTKIMKLYLNGELVDEDSNTNLGGFGYVTNDMILGAAPWFSESKNFDGHMDEIRIWRAELDQATINDWMLQDANGSHPHWDDLQLYLKCNTGSGQTAFDSGDYGNDADISTIYTWTTSEAPFRGDFDLYQSNPVGIWNGHTTTTSSILTFSGSGLSETNSAVIGYSSDPLSTVFDVGPGDYSKTMSRLWRATTQGTSGAVTITADISEIPLENISEVALIGAPTPDELPSGTVFDGATINGNTVTVSGVTLQDGWYYTLSFKIGSVSTKDLEETAVINISPNPTNGLFEVNIDLQESGDVYIQVLNIAGQEVAQQSYNNQQGIYTAFDLTDFPKGIYLIKVQQGDAISTQRIVVQ